MSDAELIYGSLEKIAETVEDISPMVYARLFTARPEEAGRNFKLAKQTNALPAFPRTSIPENVPASIAG